METKSVNFTQEEAQVLINLIDIAIKAKGLEAAEAGVILTKRIVEVFNAKEESKKEEIKQEETK